MSRMTNASRVLGPSPLSRSALCAPAVARPKHSCHHRPGRLYRLLERKARHHAQDHGRRSAGPYATESVDNGPSVAPRPEGAMPEAPAGFKVELYARTERPAADPHRSQWRPVRRRERAGSQRRQRTVKVFRGVGADGKPKQMSDFATGLKQPFGIAFYPLGPEPEVGLHRQYRLRGALPYKNGDLKATGPAQSRRARSARRRTPARRRPLDARCRLLEGR